MDDVPRPSICGDRHGGAPRVPAASRAGLTLLEVLVVIVLLGVGTAVAWAGWDEFRQSSVVSRSAELVASDIGLTRAYAVQRGEPVTLAADEADRTYRIRDTSGEVLTSRSFSSETSLPLTLLDVRTADDAITFDSRGFLEAGETVEVDVGRLGDSRSVFVNVAGRTRIEAP